RLVVDPGPAAVPIAPVLGLTVDSKGNLLIRLPERNLLRYADGVFENTLRTLQPRELAITAMARTSDGAVLLSGITNGTLKYSGGPFETLAPVSALPPSPVVALAQSSDGTVWLGTQNAGLFSLNHGRVTHVSKGVSGRKINSLLAVGDEVWIAT